MLIACSWHIFQNLLLYLVCALNVRQYHVCALFVLFYVFVLFFSFRSIIGYLVYPNPKKKNSSLAKNQKCARYFAHAIETIEHLAVFLLSLRKYKIIFE